MILNVFYGENLKQQFTDTIKQWIGMNANLLIMMHIYGSDWYLFFQVTDKVLEKLIEDEDFVAGK